MKKNITVTFRLPEDLHAALQSAAAKSSHSMNLLAVDAIRRSLEPPRSENGYSEQRLEQLLKTHLSAMEGSLIARLHSGRAVPDRVFVAPTNRGDNAAGGGCEVHLNDPISGIETLGTLSRLLKDRKSFFTGSFLDGGFTVGKSLLEGEVPAILATGGVANVGGRGQILETGETVMPKADPLLVTPGALEWDTPLENPWQESTGQIPDTLTASRLVDIRLRSGALLVHRHAYKVDWSLGKRHSTGDITHWRHAK